MHRYIITITIAYIQLWEWAQKNTKKERISSLNSSKLDVLRIGSLTDRLNPKYLPDILLWLNRISEIDKWIVNIIISADPNKLAEWIKSSNSQYVWNEWYEFLEKIIDTPYYIDNLTYETKYQFWNNYKIDLINDFEWFKSIESIIEYLPDNIRQIKRFFRFVYTYIPELKRYWDQRINFESLLIVSLFKLENPSQCYEFITQDIKGFKRWMILRRNHREEAEKFKNTLKSEIKKRYFDYFSGQLFFSNDLEEYYYFFDNIAFLTQKEFLEMYIEKNNSFSNLLCEFNNDGVALLEFLSFTKEVLYWKMVEKDFKKDMKKHEKEVKKTYSFIEKNIDELIEWFFIDSVKLKSIITNLVSHDNFTWKGSGINYWTHRRAERRILKVLISKVHPDIIFKIRYELTELDILDNINKLYWEHFLESFNTKIYWYHLCTWDLQSFIYDSLIKKKKIKEINNLDFTDIVHRNWQYLLYSFLDSCLKNRNTEKEIKIIKWKNFQEFLSKINFSMMNHRSLGSLNNEIMKKLPDEYKKYFSKTITQIEKNLMK